jgi:hypothetical protein
VVTQVHLDRSLKEGNLEIQVHLVQPAQLVNLVQLEVEDLLVLLDHQAQMVSQDKLVHVVTLVPLVQVDRLGNQVKLAHLVPLVQLDHKALKD